MLALPVSPGQALLYSQVALSFGIPFALFPLLMVTRDASLTGKMVSGWAASALLLVTLMITGLNAYLIGQLIAGAL